MLDALSKSFEMSECGFKLVVMMDVVMNMNC